jgi:phosphatidylglycerol:prolipoprotein diacylglycerol transferase
MEMVIPYPQMDPAIFTLPALQLGGLTLGPFALRWYALAYIGGLILGWRYIVALGKRPALWAGAKAPYTTPQADDYLLYATLGVILGGRLGYVFFYQPEILARNPLELFAIWQGGMSFHGGVIGVILVTLIFCRSQKINVLQLGDAVAAAVPIGMFFGRIANFINGELWGRPTDAPWAMIFPAAGPEPRHPSQLYSAALEGVVMFAILALAIWRFGALKRPGLVIGIYLIGAGLCRIIIEQFREPDRFLPDYPLGLTMGMMLSTPMLLAGLAFVAFALRRPAHVSAGRS